MDVAVIDWKDSKFEKDVLYEDINAPQWIDFSDADPPVVNDEAWFCRPDCNHPKTVEDFFSQRTPNSAKLQRSASVSAVSLLGEQNSRDATLKKRGFPLTKNSKSTKIVYDCENLNPNFSTPPINKVKSLKEMIKSSSEKNQLESDELLQKEEPPKLLKSTLLAKNLFSGKDIFSQVSEFCNELKRLAIRTKEGGEKETPKKIQMAAKKQEMGVLQEIKSERMPLLVKKEKYDEIQKQGNVKEKLSKKKLNCESENTPSALNMKNIRGKEEDQVLQIRTNPPSPQCFSATKTTTPSKASRLRPQERGVLEEIEGISIKKEVKKEVKLDNKSQSASLSPHNEASLSKGLDVFWMFKPCTLSS